MAAPLDSPVLLVDIRRRFPAFELQLQHQFPAGFTVVFGSSGAGKSTLLDCVAGLLRPDSGKIELGIEVFFDTQRNISRPPQKRRIGYVFQSLALFPHLTVEENVGFGLHQQSESERRQKIVQALADFHIERLSKRKPAELSGGEKQRVGIARALAADPPLLLFDEPFAALDPITRLDLQHLFLELRRSVNKTALFVTHDIREALMLASRIALLKDGALDLVAEPHEFRTANTQEARAFLACLEQNG